MKPQCTTAAACLRELARVMEQFGISSALNALGSSYIKCSGYISAHAMPAFTYPEDWQFAIAEVEGKPVFIGDELYDVNNGTKHKIANGICSASDWSWNPPRPKTVTVTYTIDEAKRVINALKDYAVPVAAKSAIAATEKALEELK